MNVDEKAELLSQLRTVHLPDVSRWPAFGWWVLLVAIIVISLLIWWLRERHKNNLWHREAKQEVQRIRAQLDTQSISTTLGDTSRLARRLLLVARPRKDVASLHGKDWLAALDEICDRPLFVTGFGQLLESAQYQANPDINTADLNSLLDAIDELLDSTRRGSP